MDNTLELFARTGDGVWAVDADQHIVLWNQAAEKLLGYTAEEAIGQFSHELLGGRDAEGQPVYGEGCPARECAQQGRDVESFNMQVRCRDGQASWLSVSASSPFLGKLEQARM